MKAKKITSLVLAAALAASTLMGCGSETSQNISKAVSETSLASATGETLNTDSEQLLATQTNQSLATETLFDKAVRQQHVKLKGNSEDTVTILVYMNGSNLESEDGEATTDLSEIVAAGQSDNVNILVQTMGTKKWNKKYGIASDRSQRYKVTKNGLTLVEDDLGQLDCTTASTLSDFISWGAENYPADRYILQFWNHGGGPVYGYGYDEWNSDEYASLSTDEIQTALKTAGVYFDFIGMDCCIMSCLEVCAALYDYCDYMILSEDFESGLGWSYTGWVKALIQDSSTSTVDVAKIAIDDMVSANENSSYGDSSILTLIDESKIKLLYTAWVDFAYANEDTLLNTNYSRKLDRSDRALPLLSRDDYYDYETEEYSLSDYYITDIMSVASNIDSDESAALSSALSNTVAYSNCTSSDEDLSGIAVTLPYGDSDFYDSMETVFLNCGFDEEYVSWLEKFVSAEGSSDYYDYDDSDWSGWDDYDDDYDWSEWDYYDDDSYWEDSSWSAWDSWNYDDSVNESYDDYYYSDDDYDYSDDDYDYSDDDYDYSDDDDDYYDYYYSDDYDYDDYDYDDYGYYDYYYSDDDYNYSNYSYSYYDDDYDYYSDDYDDYDYYYDDDDYSDYDWDDDYDYYDDYGWDCYDEW